MRALVRCPAPWRKALAVALNQRRWLTPSPHQRSNTNPLMKARYLHFTAQPRPRKSLLIPFPLKQPQAASYPRNGEGCNPHLNQEVVAQKLKTHSDKAIRVQSSLAFDLPVFCIATWCVPLLITWCHASGSVRGTTRYLLFRRGSNALTDGGVRGRTGRDTFEEEEGPFFACDSKIQNNQKGSKTGTKRTRFVPEPSKFRVEEKASHQHRGVLCAR